MSLATITADIDQRPVLEHLVNSHGWKKGAEVGLLRGKTFFHMLKTFPNLRLVGIDPWLTGLPGFGDKNGRRALTLTTLTSWTNTLKGSQRKQKSPDTMAEQKFIA